VGYPQYVHGSYFLVRTDGTVLTPRPHTRKTETSEGYLHIFPYIRNSLDVEDLSPSSVASSNASDLQRRLEDDTSNLQLPSDLPCPEHFFMSQHKVLFPLEIEQVLQGAHPRLRQIAVRLHHNSLSQVECAVVMDDVIDTEALEQELKKSFGTILADVFGLQLHSLTLCEEFSVRNGRTDANGALRRKRIFASASDTEDVKEETIIIGSHAKVFNTGFYCRQYPDGLLSLLGVSEVHIEAASLTRTTTAHELSRHSLLDRVYEGIAAPVFAV